MPFLIVGIVGLVAMGYSAKMVGDGVENTGHGALKIAVAGGVIYYLYKRVK